MMREVSALKKTPFTHVGAETLALTYNLVTGLQKIQLN